MFYFYILKVILKMHKKERKQNLYVIYNLISQLFILDSNYIKFRIIL